MNLAGFSNSDWAGDIEERKSTHGLIFHLGKVVSWSSKEQQAIAPSTAEKLNTWLLEGQYTSHMVEKSNGEFQTNEAYQDLLGH